MREQGSTASYADTLKVLETQNITVYALAWKARPSAFLTGCSASTCPRPESCSAIATYCRNTSATGGGTVYNELSQADIERVYAKAIGDARNQYTLGYTPSRASEATADRSTPSPRPLP